MATPQVPIGSGFGPATTASDVIRAALADRLWRFSERITGVMAMN